MSQFVPSFSTQQLLPPWVSLGAKNWAFILSIEPDCIQDYLDTWFNAPGPDVAPYYWQAMESSRYGVLMVCDHSDFSSERHGVAGYERLAHREVFWFFPVYRYQRTPDNLLTGAPKVVWVQPFALDNNSFVMFSSREIWGCEKDMAAIHAHEGARPDDLHIDIAMEGCKTFTPTSISHRIGVMHMAITPSDKPFPWQEVLDFPGLGALLGDFLADVMSRTQPTDPNEKPLLNVMEINTVKQFRDAFDLRYAAYRAIVASRVTHTVKTDGQFFAPENVTVDFLWSASFADRFTKLFGLTPPSKGWKAHGHPHGKSARSGQEIDWDMPRVSAKVAFAVAFTSDSRFEVLNTLHTYGQKR